MFPRARWWQGQLKNDYTSPPLTSTAALWGIAAVPRRIKPHFNSPSRHLPLRYSVTELPLLLETAQPRTSPILSCPHHHPTQAQALEKPLSSPLWTCSGPTFSLAAASIARTLGVCVLLVLTPAVVWSVGSDRRSSIVSFLILPASRWVQRPIKVLQLVTNTSSNRSFACLFSYSHELKLLGRWTCPLTKTVWYRVFHFPSWPEPSRSF